jgi:hypothetical protein
VSCDPHVDLDLEADERLFMPDCQLEEIFEQLRILENKIDAINVFNRKLEPFLPLLRKAAEMVDNPASRLRRLRSR